MFGFPLLLRRGYTCDVGKDSVAIGALLGAIAGAALGRYVEKLWTSEPPQDDFGERLARLEREIEELEALQSHPLAAQKSTDSRHRSDEHTSELQPPDQLVCRLLLDKKTEHR